MDINSRNLGQQEEDLDKKKFRKRASMSRPNVDTSSITEDWGILGSLIIHSIHSKTHRQYHNVFSSSVHLFSSSLSTSFF